LLQLTQGPLLGKDGKEEAEDDGLAALAEEEEVQRSAQFFLRVTIADPCGKQMVEVIYLSVRLLREVLLQVHPIITMQKGSNNLQLSPKQEDKLVRISQKE
jgi:hypothetical protein